MVDREKVIKGLECCTKKLCIYKDTEKECPYSELCGDHEEAFEDCTTVLSKDALALLKAQEPRVMTVDEIRTLNNGDVVWIEFSDGRLLPMIVEDGCLMRWRYLWRICEDAFHDDDYQARAWTSRPTKEQMEATPWTQTNGL